MVYGCSSAPLAARQSSSRIVGYLRLHIWSLSRLVQARVWAVQVQVDVVGTWTRYFWYQVPIQHTLVHELCTSTSTQLQGRRGGSVVLF